MYLTKVKWTAEQWTRIIIALSIGWALFCLSLALSAVLIVPLFTPDTLSEEGTKTYKEIAIAIVAVVSLAIGTGLGAVLVKNKVV